MDPTPPSPEEAAARYNADYGKRRAPLDPKNTERCEEVAKQMVDFSHFMRLYQQKFGIYFNRRHGRRGALWADRFKSVILEGVNALWNCVKYVELNPVRAKLVEDPADYRWCSWGRFCGSGKHPFGDNFYRHMKQSLGERARNWGEAELLGEFRGQLFLAMAAESGMDSDAAVEEMKEARKPESMQIRFLRRTRYWTDGAIIGSEAFVRDVASQFWDKTRVKKKRLARGTDSTGGVLHSFRRLRPDTE